MKRAVSPILTLISGRVESSPFSARLTTQVLLSLKERLDARSRRTSLSGDPVFFKRLDLLQEEFQLLSFAQKNPKEIIFTTYRSEDLYDDIAYWLSPAPTKYDNGPLGGKADHWLKAGMLHLCRRIETIMAERRREQGNTVLLQAAQLEVKILRSCIENNFEPLMTIPALFNSIVAKLRHPSLRPIPAVRFTEEAQNYALVSWFRERYSIAESFWDEEVIANIFAHLQRELSSLWAGRHMQNQEMIELGSLEAELRDIEPSAAWDFLGKAKAFIIDIPLL